MTKELNLLSLIQAHQNLTPDGFTRFISYHGSSVKDGEMDDLRVLISLLTDKYGFASSNLEGFFVGYKIPQIGKEFDLLRFGTNYHINIELKSKSTEEKILTQLKRNRYYLKFLGKEVYYLTFVSETNTLYKLKEDASLDKINIGILLDILQKQEVDTYVDVNKRFNPSDYLVSPFNSTERFLGGEYFLTNQQEEVRSKIVDLIDQSAGANFISLDGGAGTGKTLLAYDIVKFFWDRGHKVLIFHCGKLNDGQQELIDRGWKISSIKSFQHHDLSNFDLVLIDEAQRIHKHQLEKISEDISNNNGNCIFAYDKLQTLSSNEVTFGASGKIMALCGENKHSLSEKIRTNKEISNFIKALLNKRRNLEFYGDNIQVRYFYMPKDVKNFLSSLDEEKWTVLRFTPSQYKQEFHDRYSLAGHMKSHEVIGQEFEGVAVVIDKFFTYDYDGNLTYNNSTYYLATKMLFQNLTRARKRLLIIILQNEELLTRCISIT